MKKNLKTINMLYAALFAVIITVCTWISIPASIPFTMQTFAIFCALGLLGGKLGTVSILVYILLGAIGIPVFAGFNSGVSALSGPTGGYILGFIFMGLIYWLITYLFGTKLWITIFAMTIGTLLCYSFGTIWFMRVYASRTGEIGLATALTWCVIPFIIPDIIKMALAVLVTKRVKPAIDKL